ncbi:MAG: hypothetical protein BGO01_13455 [Armatimonadetes bacterium 55-13]|nr:hypothetical protein [Armatimonadota bacterium]OJU61915.1 MAG: hypothetical protein BGO01_13455 [Armatimonadetes bacterium 55-13]
MLNGGSGDEFYGKDLLMRLDDLRKRVHGDLACRLAEHGFTTTKSSRVYRKKLPGGHASLRLEVVNHPGIDFDVLGYMGVRIDAVEEMVNVDRPHWSAADLKKTLTVEIEFGNFIRGMGIRHSVENERMADEAAQALYELTVQYGFPYYENFIRPEYAFEVLSQFDEINRGMNCPIAFRRGQRLLALSILLKRELEPELLEKIRAKIARQTPSVDDFERMLERVMPTR